MYLIYQLLLIVSLPFYVVRLLYKAVRNRAYLDRFWQRFGFGIPYRDFVWVHAVSVGECQAAVPIIKAMGLQNVVVSTTTPTGYAQLKRVLPDVGHFYLPFDLFITKRWVAKHKPRALVLIESELWPKLVHNVPKVILANGRLSKRSMQRYKKFTFARTMLNNLSLILAQKAEAQLFQQITNVPVEEVGNSKWDKQIAANLVELAQSAKQSRPVLIAASTHESEEQIAIDAFRVLKKTIPDCLLIVVPRHPERFAQVRTLCAATEFTTHTRTIDNLPISTTDIFVADSMGELMAWYLVADVALVCGSFVEKGAHDPIEALLGGCQVFVGPSTYNIENILEHTGTLVKRTDKTNLVNDLLAAFNKDCVNEGRLSQEFVMRSQGSAADQAAKILSAV